jgi:hypothetical protein
MGQRGGSAARQSGRVDLLVAAGCFAAGWLFIMAINRWHIGPPVVFLTLGWLSVILCGLFFVGSARAAAGEGTGPEQEGFELTAGRLEELEKEKRALLKAIKEVEFDREMGKMSEEDADEISRVYRARAIDILKELEGGAEVGAASLDQVIERELRARLALAGVAARKKAKAKPEAEAAKPEAAKPEAAKPETAAEPQADAEPEAEAKPEATTEQESRSAVNGKSAPVEDREDA